MAEDTTETAHARRHRTATWVAREIIPHEGGLRRWFLRQRINAQDVDELIQETYCRLSLLDSFDHIEVPRAYFFSIARNLYLRRLRRQKIVQFEEIAQIEALRDDAPSLDQALASKMEYHRMLAMIGALPERCRRIVELRKIEGWSQREIAEHLGITQKAVEKQIWLGVKAVRAAWSATEQPEQDPLARPGTQQGGRR